MLTQELHTTREHWLEIKRRISASGKPSSNSLRKVIHLEEPKLLTKQLNTTPEQWPEIKRRMSASVKPLSNLQTYVVE